MSRKRRSTMSEQLKNELAKDLGFYDTVQREGWGSIKAKDAGNMVKRAIQLAEQTAAKQYQEQQQAPAFRTPHVNPARSYAATQPVRRGTEAAIPTYMQHNGMASTQIPPSNLIHQ